MLNKLFGRASTKSAAAVEAMSADANATELRRLVAASEPAVAAEALKKLQDLSLAAARLKAEDQVLSEAATEVVREALANGRLEPGQPLPGQTLPETLDALRRIDDEQSQRWLRGVPESGCLTIALNATMAPARQLAAEHLESTDVLKQLQRSAKGHDNTLYRFAKSRLQSLRAAQNAVRERNETLAHVRDGLRKLTETTYDPLLEGRLHHLLDRFRQLNPSDEELAQVEPLKMQVEQRIAARKASTPSPRDDSRPEPADASGPGAIPDPVAPVGETVEPAVSGEPEAVPTEATSNEDEVNEAHPLEEPASEPRDSIPESEREAVRAVRGLIRRGRGAVRAGHLRQARGIWGSIENQLEQLPETRHAGVWSEAHEYRDEMEKLADWQDFAVVPKKEELIEHMKALAERTMHPQDKADAVQQLQQEWRKLSQGAGGRHQALWETFHHWAEAAYEPCRAYFAEQDELHAVNLTKRRELIDQLHQYLETNDWHNPDWAEVEKVLRLAARDWRHFTPVKPADHRATEKAYHAAVKQIRDKLHEEYDRNQAERERIIEQAEALREEEDLRYATEQLKKLQREWKAAGRTHRKEDHRLWQAFRAICDDVFGRRDEAAKSHKEKLEKNLVSALNIIRQVEQAADGTPEDIEAGLRRLDEWRSEFDACRPLPRARYEEVLRQFDDAVNALKQARTKRRQRQELEKWHALFERVKCLGELEARYWSGTPDAALCKQVARVWEDGTPLPSAASHVDGRLRRSLQRCGESPEQPEEVLTANRETLRKLVVRLELLAGIESPEADSELRMGLQVERLAGQMGGGNASNDDGEAILTAWLETPVATSEEAFVELQDRFESAWRARFSS